MIRILAIRSFQSGRALTSIPSPINLNISSEQKTPGILVLNSGSSSLKFTLFELSDTNLSPVVIGSANGLTVTGDVAPTISIKPRDDKNIVKSIEVPTHAASLELIASHLKETTQLDIVAVGHRIVHGGTEFTNSSVLDDDAVLRLSTLNSLAPLHNPHHFAGILAAKSRFPRALQVGVFDTAYHQTLPDYAHLYALPYDLAKKYRRYGFHGTSHKFVVEKAAKFLGKSTINAVSFHLGNGCSVACIKDSKSIDTSMGFTPLAGLMMGSRSGDIDPTVILKLVQEEGMSIEEVSEMLHNKSGLYGITGCSDSLTVEQGYSNGDPDCVTALNMFCYRAKKVLGSYLAVLNNNVDCLIFTAGIGENSPLIQQMICEGLFPVDHGEYSRGQEICDITDYSGTEDAKVKVLVVKTNEELAIARECMTFLGTD